MKMKMIDSKCDPHDKKKKKTVKSFNKTPVGRKVLLGVGRFYLEKWKLTLYLQVLYIWT